MSLSRPGVLLMLLLALAALPARAGDLVLKRIMLSSGGVAYIEEEAEVNGDAELSLDVPLDQVDDVLKSIVVFDSNGGVGSATLPGRQPLEQSFKDLPFDQQALDSPADLLNALQGAEIKVGGNRPLDGKLVRVVPETSTVNGQTTPRNRVTLLTALGLQEFVLEDADSVSFVDPALQAKVDKALAEISDNRAKNRRRLALTIHGTGKRTLWVGYVVGAPLWKASYRIVLPSDPNAVKAHLQGWAVLENMSGQDWHDVELTLLAGNPVSFRQAIYEAYYVNRPEVPVDVVGHILPPPDNEEATAAQAKPGPMMLRNIRSPTAAYTPMPVMAAPPMAPTFNTAAASESETQVAFRIPAPVTLPSGHSAMVPIFDREVPVEKLSLYQQSVDPSHPLASLRIKNDTPTGLPPGVATLYEQSGTATSYVGDARLGSIPAGESRLVSYAADDKTQVTGEPANHTNLARATIAEGLLRLTWTDRQSYTYHLLAPANEPRHLVIEQPKQAGWTLTGAEMKTVEETPSVYRLAIDLKPGESRTLTVTFEQPREEVLHITDFDDSRIAAEAASQELAPSIRAAFVDLGKLRAVASAKQIQVDTINRKIQDLAKDQTRIRENLNSVDHESDLHKRYMAKLAEEETTIEKLQADNIAAVTERDAAEKAVSDYIAKLKL